MPHPGSSSPRGHDPQLGVNDSAMVLHGMSIELIARASLVAIGASVGGTEALSSILRALPAGSPPILVVQHLTPGFTTAFARRLDQQSSLHVHEATEGTLLERGHALLAPGSRHLSVSKRSGRLVAHLSDRPPVCGHKPSVDVLFESVARMVGAGAIGAVLTGMGRDGASGLLAMRKAGAVTVAQSEESCVVFGMPRQAIACGAAEHVLAPSKLARALRSGFERADAVRSAISKSTG